MLRKVLIVDDNVMNREMLKLILQEDYKVIEAENGKKALTILRHSYESISAVLLDLVMPELDGYEVLEQIQNNEHLKQVPVIVATSNAEENAEVRALALGAKDYITKPYNPAIIMHRLWNTINLRESAAIINATRRDTLTGLYSREAFFRKAAEMIADKKAGYYVMACFDIDDFKVINDQHGNEKGDEVLKHVADVLYQGFSQVGGICCRMMADVFAVLYPSSFMDSEELKEIRKKASVQEGFSPITFSIGRYRIDDLTLSISAMYDRANMAEVSIKKRYDIRIAQYDESMRKHILHEQKITSEMNSALEKGQFEVWFQPQYNHASGALIGSEALVRWRHPENGLISPSDFVPVFERNGFIYEMDKYVWKQTCKCLKKWMKKGLPMLPVSVNISRYDIFRDDLYPILTGLIEEYQIPVELLCLEITESAFAESTVQIVKVVKWLRDYGFTVEIDDFGSGYSSLNTLKDVPASVLKLDMRFLEEGENGENSSRGGNIVESVVRMAKWLGMSVIAEGVETVEQADYLRSICCNYVQGYLYAKPMPEKEYEEVLAKCEREEKLPVMETVDTLDNNTFWDPRSLETLIFNSYVGAACIFEYRCKNIEILRANGRYAKVISGEFISLETAIGIEWKRHMSTKAYDKLLDTIETAIELGDEITDEMILQDIFKKKVNTYLRYSIRMIAHVEERYLFYCMLDNVTAQREAERKEAQIAAQLQAIMSGINGGVTAVTIKDGVPRFLFANNQYYEQLGYTKRQFEKEVPNAFELVCKEDRDKVIRLTNEASKSRKSMICTYRATRRDGKTVWLQSNISITTIPDVKEPVQLAVANDISNQIEMRDKFPWNISIEKNK